MDINLVSLLAAMIVASTPLLLAAIGELVVERSGGLNLGVEGMMLTGAVCGFTAGHESSSAVMGFAGAALGGALVSAVFGFLTLFLLTNQVATGLALALFGAGLAAMLGQGYTTDTVVAVPKIEIPLLSDIPGLGRILFSHDAVVYLSIAIVIGVWAFLKYSRQGLILRAIGENHDAAHALGYNVKWVRFLAIMFGGACAGLGGAYVSLVRVPQWIDNITAGAGWIALAIVVFAGWKPWRLVAGAYLFGGMTALQLNIQGNNGKLFGVSIPVEYLSMAPFIATIVVLAVLAGSRQPGSLGKAFQASS